MEMSPAFIHEVGRPITEEQSRKRGGHSEVG